MRILHVISNLGIGGAELSLCSLIEQTVTKGLDHVVVSLLSDGVLRPRLEQAGATVIELPGQRGVAGTLMLQALGAQVAGSKPDIVHAWMYHSNLAATVSKGLGYYKCPLVWSIRQSIDEPALDRLPTRAVIWLGARLSASPDAIVYNSSKAALTHEAKGFSASERCIIFNGVDCERFKPRPDLRASSRAQFGLKPDATLIGRVGRYSPMKDFDTLLSSFRKVLDARPSTRLLLVGTQINIENRELVSLCRRHDCLDYVHLVGPRLDVEMIYPGLDVLVSSSSANESFPNVVAEALASGVLVVATSVGEEFLINEGAHRVVPPRNAVALSEAILGLAGLGCDQARQLSKRGRQFIETNFSMDAFAEKHMRLYRRLLLRDAKPSLAS